MSSASPLGAATRESMKILFIAAKPPDPPLRGYQLRAHHQLRLLGRRHRVTLLCFGGGKDAPADDAAAAPLCEETIVVPYSAAGMVAGLCGGVLTGRPLQTAIHETPAMSRAVGRLLAERRHDLVHVQLARMAGCVEETALLPRVIDLVDALSLNFQRRSGYDRAPFGIAAPLEARRRVAFGDEGAEKRARPIETALRAVAIEFRNESRNQCEAAPIRAALVGLIPSGLIPFGFVRFGCRRLIRDLLRRAGASRARRRAAAGPPAPAPGAATIPERRPIR